MNDFDREIHKTTRLILQQFFEQDRQIMVFEWNNNSWM